MNNIANNDFVNIDPEILHGTPVFKGMRVPFDTLIDYLATGNSLDKFLDEFSTRQDVRGNKRCLTTPRKNS